jgi:hypothetical protein
MMALSDAIATVVDSRALAALVASQTNDDMQAMLVARRKLGLRDGLGDSRAIRAAIQAKLMQEAIGHLAELLTRIMPSIEIHNINQGNHRECST